MGYQMTETSNITPGGLFNFGAAADNTEADVSPTPAVPAPTNQTPDGLFDFGDNAAPTPVDGPLQEITDPLGRPLINQPPPRQWSVFATPLPGTQAAEQGADIHPLSRAVLQNFDLTSDISANSAALKKIVKGVYGPVYNRSLFEPPSTGSLTGLPVDDMTDAQLEALIAQPKVSRALQLDSITRRRMAEDAEEAAILRGEIPLMLAAEGRVDTMVRMMRPAETRTPEAIMAQLNRGPAASVKNALQREVDPHLLGHACCVSYG
jgi:hypothetical protein